MEAQGWVAGMGLVGEGVCVSYAGAGEFAPHYFLFRADAVRLS
jgi:hypothetical protein